MVGYFLFFSTLILTVYLVMALGLQPPKALLKPRHYRRVFGNIPTTPSSAVFLHAIATLGYRWENIPYAIALDCPWALWEIEFNESARLEIFSYVCHPDVSRHMKLICMREGQFLFLLLILASFDFWHR